MMMISRKALQVQAMAKKGTTAKVRRAGACHLPARAWPAPRGRPARCAGRGRASGDPRQRQILRLPPCNPAVCCLLGARMHPQVGSRRAAASICCRGAATEICSVSTGGARRPSLQQIGTANGLAHPQTMTPRCLAAARRAFLGEQT